MSEAVFHRLDHGAVMAWLREYAKRDLAARPEVEEVRLIGSLARDDWSARSDADLVVLVDRASDRPAFRSQRYAPSGKVPVPVDILVYTREEAQGWRPRFRAEVDRGTVLYRRGDAEPRRTRQRGV